MVYYAVIATGVVAMKLDGLTSLSGPGEA